MFLALSTACAPIVPYDAAGDDVVVDGQRYRLEWLAKSDPGVVLIGAGWLRHPQRGVLSIHSETASRWRVRVAVLDDSTAVPAAVPAPEAQPAPLAFEPEGHAAELDNGLPREGQWRRCLDLHADASGMVLLAPPARKGRRIVQRWRRHATGWQAETLPLTGVTLDYGCVAHGDFDADGRDDIALALHLDRFSAWMGRQDGRFVMAGDGLPVLRSAEGPNGSGVAIAALAHDGGDRLLLLNEPSGVATPHPAPGLAEFRWTGQRWTSVAIAPALQGSGLALARVPGCAPLLAVESANSGALPVYRRDRETWHPVVLPVPDQPGLWFATAVAAADVDRRACADLAFARRFQQAGRWSSEILVWLDATDGWRRLHPVRNGSTAEITALHLAPLGPGRGELLAGDAEGGIDRYLIDHGTIRWVGHLAPSAWRQGCGVSAIVHGDGPSGRHWVVALAGEGDLFHVTRCAAGGGLLEIEWRDGEAR